MPKYIEIVSEVTKRTSDACMASCIHAPRTQSAHCSVVGVDAALSVQICIFTVAYYGHFPGMRQRSGISMLRLRTAFIIRNLSPVDQSPNWQQSITLSSRRITFDTMGIAPKSFTHQHKVYCLSNRLNNINNQKRPLS